MTHQNITHFCGRVWLAIVRAGFLSPHTLPRTSQDTFAVVVRAQLETGLVTKDYVHCQFSSSIIRHGNTLIGLDGVQEREVSVAIVGESKNCFLSVM